MGLLLLFLIFFFDGTVKASSGNVNYTDHYQSEWDTWSWDQTIVNGLPVHDTGNIACPCLAGTSCESEPECVDTRIGDECPRRYCPIDVDNCDLPFVYREDGAGDGLVSYSTCGHDDSHQAYKELNGATLRVMYVPETPGTFLGDMSGSCIGPLENWPVGCTGFVYDNMEALQVEGNFSVEIIHEFPDSFWDGVRNYCRRTEGPNWGTEGFEATNTNLCNLQLWTMCVYAASQGYVDFCPNFAFQSDERWAYTDGLVYHTSPYTMATKFVTTDGMHQMFDLLGVWSLWTWLIVIIWVVLSSIAVRSFSGFYGSPVGDYYGWCSKIVDDFAEICWWGAGVFLDVVYPQNIPGKFGKTMMVLFELIQVFLLVSITAGVTAILLSVKSSGGLKDVEEVNAADGYFCFPFSIYAEDFKLYFPHISPSKFKLFNTEGEFMAELANPDTDCIGAINEANAWKKYASNGELCDWIPRVRVWEASDYAAVSPRWSSPMKSLFNRYKSKGIYQQRFDAANANVIGASQCEVRAHEGGFKAVSIYYFIGPLMIWSIMFIIGFVHFFFYGPPTDLPAAAYNAFTATTSIAPAATWSYEGFSAENIEETRMSSLVSSTESNDLEPTNK